MYANVAVGLNVAQFEHLISNNPADATPGTFLLSADGEVVAKVVEGGVVKCSGPAPTGSEFVRYGRRAFKNWTVADANAFEDGDIVDPFK